MDFIGSLHHNFARACQAEFLLVGCHDLEDGIVLERYRVLHGKVIGHRLEQTFGIGFIGSHRAGRDQHEHKG